MNRTFICQVVPKEMTTKFVVSQAANNFCFNLIDTKCFKQITSLVPINVSEKIVNEKENYPEYIQSRVFRTHVGVFKLLNAVLENFMLAKKNKKCENIWYYNLTPHNLLSAVLLKFLYGRNLFIILADYTPSKRIFSLQYFIKWFIENKFSGIISFSEMNEFQHENELNLAGIVPLSKIKRLKIARPVKNEFLLSGRLEESTGFTLAIETFAKLPQYKLYITGALTKEKEEQILKYDNIEYLGLLSYEKYLNLLKEIPYVLNLRNPKFIKNKNNFPSKVLESFSYNRIVISTFKYNELKGFKYFYSKYEKNSLTNLLTEICNKTYMDLLEYSDHSSLLEQNFSEKKWKKYLTKTENKIR